MIITDDAQRQTLLEAGKRLRAVLDAVIGRVVAGVRATELDAFAHATIVEQGDTPTFLGYKPPGMKKKFPATLCVSVNDEVVHGIPKEETVFAAGDVVSVDCGLIHKGLFVDSACTVIVEGGDKDKEADAMRLLDANRKALRYALVFARAGATTGDIGSAIETVADEYTFATPPELGGHGIGEAQHEDPFIPNIGNPDGGEKLKKGQVVAIEPILFEGSDPRIKLADDGFTYKTTDGSRSAHFEHTVIITDTAPTIATGPMW